jgi:serine/threonine-protein kinase
MVGPERFLREIQIEAGLQHINILPIHDSGKSDGFLYYVMPYVEGESLRVRIDREKQLPLDDALHITREIAEALSYAHHHGIVHRDIKPENILLSEGHAVLADFGIARAVGVAGGQRVTDSGHIVGTPQYMSPEQASGESDLDGRSDLYSLGCVLYEMLAGEPPFTGRTAQAVIARHIMENPPPLQVVRPSVPPAVGEAIERALAKTPPKALRFLRELRRRLVLHIGLAYLAFAWLAIEFTRTLVEHAAVERWVTPIVVLLFAVGLPLVLVTAWARFGLTRSAGRMRRGQIMSRVGLIATVATIATIITAKAFDVRIERGTDSSPVRFAPTSIAVLYLEDRSQDSSLAWLANGLTEELIDRLHDVDALDVTSQYGVRPYTGLAITPDSLGRLLGVGTFVQGNLEPIGEDIRVSMRLVDANTGNLVGTFHVEEARDDLRTLRTEVADMLATMLRERLGERIILARLKDETDSDQAWRYFQSGLQLRSEARELTGQREFAAASHRFGLADSALAEAERLDSNWLTPVLERGWLALHRGFLALRASDIPADLPNPAAAAWFRVGLEHAERALRTWPDEVGGLELRGVLNFRLGTWGEREVADSLTQAAVTDLLATTRVDPSARALYTLSAIHLKRGDLIESKLAAEKALDADVFAEEAGEVLEQLYYGSLYAEAYQDATRWCWLGQRHDPENEDFLECELYVLGWSADSGQAVRDAWRLVRSLDSIPRVRESWPHRRLLVAAILARAGRADSARAVIQSTYEALPENDSTHLHFFDAYVRTLLGDHDRALDLLRNIIRDDPQSKSTIEQHPWFRALHDLPEFQALVNAQVSP